MSKHIAQQLEFYSGYYGQLVGLRVDRVVQASGGREYGLVFLNPQGQKIFVWIMRDAEGNGPGFLSIEDEDANLLKPSNERP